MEIAKMLVKCEYLFIEEQDYSGVVEICNEILMEDRWNQKAREYKVISLYHLRQYDEALKVIDESQKINLKNEKLKKFDKLIRMKLNKEYKLFKASGDEFTYDDVERLSGFLLEAGEYEKALDCYDRLFEMNPNNISAVEGIKRVMNKSDLKVEPKFGKDLFMNWIFAIKSKSDKEPGVRIECDDPMAHDYAESKILQVKEFLTPRGGGMYQLHNEMDDLDEKEFDVFINHLDNLEFIFNCGSGYMMLLDDETIKKRPEEGKYAAPRWLVYPELSAWTIGWRMGYGEDYAMNAPWYGEEYDELFPTPLNWLFEPRECRFKHIPLLGYMWREDGKPKYSQIGDDAIVVNDFITLTDEKEFRHNHFRFTSVEHGILFAKVGLFHVDEGTGEERLEDLKPVRFSDEEEAYWQNFKYTVCLNVLYYKVMQDEELKERLLETGDRPLVYESDDEWGGEENLFGFALMELRDEIRRLYKNEGLIDWKYTEYLKYKDPYENPKPRNPEDKQSPEYKVIESVISSASRYVRDVNLDEKLAGRYEVGQIITERAFVDASARIGAMVTSHRYLILSQWMTDLSQFDEGRNWGLHVANRGSKFKVIDIYEIEGKTQIALLQLPDGFEDVFENTISLERQLVDEIRAEFEKALKSEVIEELATPEWLERCSFPLGMSDDGEFF